MDSLKNIPVFSVKNFIADLPGLLNTAFTAIKNLLSTFYSEKDNSISVKSIDVAGTVKSNSVVTNFLTVKNSNGENITISDLLLRINELQNEIANIYAQTGIKRL